MSNTAHSSAAAAYDAKDTTVMYVDQSEQAGAAAMTIQRTANLANTSMEGAASGQTNIYLPTYSAPLVDPNNGNNAVHKFKFDPNAQGINDQVYTSINDVPPGMRGFGGFSSGITAAKPNPSSFATATLSAAIASTSVLDLNTASDQSHPVEAVTHSTVASGASASGSQGASTAPPGAGTNSSLTYSYSLQ